MKTKRHASLSRFVWDEINDRCSYCSEELADLHEVTVEEFLARATSAEASLEWVHPDDHALYLSEVGKISRNAEAIEFEYRLLQRDGGHIHVREISIPGFDEDGKVVKAYGFVEDVSDRIQAERALNRSEESLSRAQRQGRIGSWTWDTQTDQLTSCSEEFARIHGVSIHEVSDLMNVQMEQVIHPEDRERVAAEFGRFDREGIDYEIEYRIIRPDGDVRHVHEIGECVFADDGVAVEQNGTVQDVTERKRIEQALRDANDKLERRVEERTQKLTQEISEREKAQDTLRASEARFRTLFYQSPLGVSLEDYSLVKSEIDRLISAGVTDLEQYYLDHPEALKYAVERIQLIDANDTLVKISGATSFEEYRELENSFDAWSDEHWAPFHIGELTALAAGETTFADEVQDTSYDGGIRIIRCTVRLAQGHENDWSEIITTHEDITERKMAERALKASEQRFRDYAEIGADWFWEMGPDLRFTYVSDHVEKVTGVPAEFHIGKSRQELAGGDRDTKVWATLNAATDARSPFQDFQYPRKGPNGVVQYMSVSGTPVFDDDDNFIGYRGSAKDVSEQHQAQLALTEAKQKAQEANQAKSNFLSTMSHEIRTPLNGVLGLAQLLTDTNLDRDQRRKVDTILSSGKTLLAIINDVLDMSRIEAGGVELEEKPFKLRNLVSMIATPFQSLTDDKGLQLKVTDRVDASLVIKGDAIRLRQILWNLLSNAIKFTNDGHVSLIIEEVSNTGDLVIETKGHVLHFSVEDSGVGIAADRLDAIFDAFTQEDSSTTRKFGGTGLGLSIVRQLTELMGGTIDVNSDVGFGTKFDVYIPFYKATSAEKDALSLEDQPENHEPVEPLNIVVAEDNEINAMIARAFLEKSGHRVKHVENGELAVRSVEENWADLILMDIHMPEMNGVDATKLIRATEVGRHLPIIGLTAEAFAERHAEFIRIGMNGVLTKPFTEQQLANVISKHRGSRGDTGGGPEVPVDWNGQSIGEATSGTKSGFDESESQERSADNPVGDDTMLDALRDGMGPQVLPTLLVKAQKALQDRVEKLRNGLEASNPDLIREAAHSIRGASGSMGAYRISELAAVIEDNAGDLDTVRNLLPEFEEVAKSTVIWWHGYSRQNLES